MIFDEEDRPKQGKTVKNLEPLSLEDLSHYIEDLKQEIIRTESEIIRKKSHMAAADSFF